MLAAAVVRSCLVALVVVVLAQQPTGWYIPVVSLCSVPGVARHDACSLPSLRAIRGPGWCTTCMCPRILAWPLVGLWFRVSLYTSTDALFFMAASSCRGRFGKIRVPFPDAQHALALSLHCLVASNGTRHLPIMEVFLHTVQPLWLRFSGSIHNSHTLLLYGGPSLRTWYAQALTGRLPALVAPRTVAIGIASACPGMVPTTQGCPCLVRQGPTASAPLLIGTWRSVAPTHPSFTGRTVDLPRSLRTAVSALPAMVLSHGAGPWSLLPAATAQSAWPMTIGLFVPC
ncbi:hypothetical protein V6N13_098916 [Hibiscus sabdariffa]|uniref:Secreted protein n=1 Tax=Hibiscus sabdariffa TaxID=183260 RepID=A0ABR2PA00_9ROSI